MSELKIDNPAQRLLDILEEGQRRSASANCRVVWTEVLGARGQNEQILITRLAKVMELPARISQVLVDHFPNTRWKSTHWKTQVESAFISQELNGLWQKFKGNIDAMTLSELGLLSEMFETRGAHAGINTEDIGGLLERIAELRGEIRVADMPATMKTQLLKQLAQIQDALESYSISGIEPVMDAVQSTLGLAVIDPDYKEEIKSGSGSQFGDRISALLGDVANVVTVAGALPALPAAIQTALGLLSK